MRTVFVCSGLFFSEFGSNNRLDRNEDDFPDRKQQTPLRNELDIVKICTTKNKKAHPKVGNYVNRTPMLMLSSCYFFELALSSFRALAALP